MHTNTCKHTRQRGNFCSECGAKTGHQCSHNLSSNFCSRCGEAVREKCPECGAMELIGRKFCNVEVKNAEECHQEYREKVGEWRIGLFFTLSLLSALYGAFFESISFMIIVPISCVFLGAAWQFVAVTAIDKKFARDFPEYMEALDETGYWKWDI